MLQAGILKKKTVLQTPVAHILHTVNSIITFIYFFNEPFFNFPVWLFKIHYFYLILMLLWFTHPCLSFKYQCLLFPLLFSLSALKGVWPNKPKLLALTVHVRSHDTITKRNSGDRKILDKGRGMHIGDCLILNLMVMKRL